ncbi:MAG: FAD:protein FMN transferase [Bifidobacteriaceae bacterium]|jgi:thiamine biosynthesis lipoprotein ApbE|nr:FAD:protein FMN transferase [Bifidobacteriaceae bacterium]
MGQQIITATFGRDAGSHHVVHAMGTTFSVLTPGVDSTPVMASIAAEWHELEQLFSPDLPSSEISRLRRGTLAWSQADNRVHSMAYACRRLQLDTDGLFSAWEQGWFDPAGYATGWAIRAAAAGLYACGITNFCISSSGATQVAGRGPKGGWQVSVTDRFHPAEPATVVRLPAPGELAVATVTAATAPGPDGVPASGDLTATATVVGDAIDQVSAIAAAAIAAGTSAARTVHQAGFEGFGRDPEGESWWTSGMSSLAVLAA